MQYPHIPPCRHSRRKKQRLSDYLLLFCVSHFSWIKNTRNKSSQSQSHREKKLGKKVSNLFFSFVEIGYFTLKLIQQGSCWEVLFVLNKLIILYSLSPSVTNHHKISCFLTFTSLGIPLGSPQTQAYTHAYLYSGSQAGKAAKLKEEAFNRASQKLTVGP